MHNYKLYPSIRARAAAAAFAALLACLGAAPAGAGGRGTTGAAFLKTGVGARALAMGRAFSALPDDASATDWNPAALAAVTRPNIAASYNSLLPDQNQGALSAAAPVKWGGTLGASVSYLRVSDIPRRAGDTEAADSYFDNANTAAVLAYGRRAGGGLALGAGLKHIRESLDSFSESALAADLGVLYEPGVRGLTTALTVLNLGGRIGPDPLPLAIKGGAAYKFSSGKLTLASDLEWQPRDERLYLQFGAERLLYKALSIRAGYQAGKDADDLGGLDGFACGFGLKSGGPVLDYAFVPFGDLGDTHRLTIGFSF